MRWPYRFRKPWPHRWMELWHNDTAARVVVPVLWPRYHWLKGLDAEGRPQDVATMGEVNRAYKIGSVYHFPWQRPGWKMPGS